MTRIWDGTKRVIRALDRLFIWYCRICLLIWVVVLGCMWIATSYHAGRVLGFDEVTTAVHAWANDAR